MNASHVTGGGLGALLGVVISALLSKYANYDVTVTDAALIGSSAVAAGVGLGHAIGLYGIKGLFARLWSGEPKPAPAAKPPAVPQSPPAA